MKLSFREMNDRKFDAPTFHSVSPASTTAGWPRSSTPRRPWLLPAWFLGPDSPAQFPSFQFRLH